MKDVNGPQTRRRMALAVAAVAILAGAATAWFAYRPAGVPDEIWLRAQMDLKANRIDRAEAGLARLGRLRPPTPLDWMLRAQVAMARNRTDEAVDDLARIPDGHPLAAQAQLLAGQLELRRNRARSAEKHLRAAIERDPGLVQAHSELIYLYGTQLRRTELNEQFNALSRLTPLNFANVWLWCLVRNTVWEPLENAEILTRYLKADSGDRWSRLALVEDLRQVGRRGEAEKALSVLDESDPEARVLRVELALDRGDDGAAEALLAGGPADHPGLARLRGRFALARGQGPAAVCAFRTAYNAEPDNRETINGLANALKMVGDLEAAAPFAAQSRAFDILSTLMQRASLAQAREDAMLIRQLGAACEAVHRVPEAKAWFRLAISLDPLDDEAQRALFRLKQADLDPKGTGHADSSK